MPGSHFKAGGEEERMRFDAIFRAKLAIPQQRKLYDYWRDCAGSRRMPSRRDIEAVAIPELLPGISMLEVKDALDTLTFTLAGTRLRDIFGTEVTNKRFFSLDLGDKRGYWRENYRTVIRESRPVEGVVKGPVAGREHLLLFWLRLPLSDDGVCVNKLLCHDFAATAPGGGRE